MTTSTERAFNRALNARRKEHAELECAEQEKRARELKAIEAREDAVEHLEDALQRFHNELKTCSKYVSCSVMINLDDRPNYGSWLDLCVIDQQIVRVRAIRNPSNLATAIVEFRDGKTMTLPAYKRWATAYAADGAVAAEQNEIPQGNETPQRKEPALTYDQGFSKGQSWARSLTVSLLCRISNWSIEVDKVKRKDRPSSSVLGVWLSERGGDKSGGLYYFREEEGEYHCEVVKPNWAKNLAKHLIETAYYEGFYVGAVGVARRVYSNSAG